MVDEPDGVINELLGWTLIVVGCVSAVIALAAIYTWPRGDRCRCPGPRLPWRKRASVLRWLWRGRCWYNLTGHCGGNHLICPECGSDMACRRLLRDGRRLGLGRLGAILCLVAMAAGSICWVRGGSWTAAVPTLPLVALSNTDLGSHRTSLRGEAAQRLADGRVTGLAARILAQAIIEDLRHDGRRWNAHHAIDFLNTLWPHSQPALEAELGIGDGQSRPVAADILRALSPQPSDALLAATVADLRDDGGEPGWYLRQRNARRAASYLLSWPDHAEPFVREALGSEDPQQRMLAAAVAGFCRHIDSMDQAVPILISHLRDNSVYGDAKIAAPALYRFGRAALPLLVTYADDDDLQAASAVRHIIERIEHPQRSWSECEHRMPRITNRTHDPVGTSLEFMLEYY